MATDAPRAASPTVLVRSEAVALSADGLHRFHAYFRERAVRRRYCETLQATTDALSGIADPLGFPKEAFSPLAALIAKAVAWAAGNKVAAAG